jgi:hypothetical protein
MGWVVTTETATQKITSNHAHVVVVIFGGHNGRHEGEVNMRKLRMGGAVISEAHLVDDNSRDVGRSAQC